MTSNMDVVALADLLAGYGTLEIQYGKFVVSASIASRSYRDCRHAREILRFP